MTFYLLSLTIQLVSLTIQLVSLTIQLVRLGLTMSYAIFDHDSFSFGAITIELDYVQQLSPDDAVAYPSSLPPCRL